MYIRSDEEAAEEEAEEEADEEDDGKAKVPQRRPGTENKPWLWYGNKRIDKILDYEFRDEECWYLIKLYGEEVAAIAVLDVNSCILKMLVIVPARVFLLGIYYFILIFYYFSDFRLFIPI